MKVLFLPHCLRNFEYCDNKYDENGLICSGEHGCGIGRLKEYAMGLGYDVYIVPGGSLFEKLVKKLNPDFIVGVACNKEIKLAEGFLDGNYQSIELLVDGCIDTEVNEEKVKEVLDAN